MGQCFSSDGQAGEGAIPSPAEGHHCEALAGKPPSGPNGVLARQPSSSVSQETAAAKEGRQEPSQSSQRSGSGSGGAHWANSLQSPSELQAVQLTLLKVRA